MRGFYSKPRPNGIHELQTSGNKTNPTLNGPRRPTRTPQRTPARTSDRRDPLRRQPTPRRKPHRPRAVPINQCGEGPRACIQAASENSSAWRGNRSSISSVVTRTDPPPDLISRSLNPPASRPHGHPHPAGRSVAESHRQEGPRDGKTSRPREGPGFRADPVSLAKLGENCETPGLPMGLTEPWHGVYYNRKAHVGYFSQALDSKIIAWSAGYGYPKALVIDGS